MNTSDWMRGATGLFSVVYWVATQVVSFVGLQTQEQTVTIQPGQTTQLDLTLQETARQLIEVQVRGYKSANQVPVSVGKVAIKPLDLPQSVAVIDRDVLDR